MIHYEKRVAFEPDRSTPTKLIDFRTWVDNIIAGIPEEYRSDARIELTPQNFCGDEYVGVEISYTRPMLHHETVQHKMLSERS